MPDRHRHAGGARSLKRTGTRKERTLAKFPRICKAPNKKARIRGNAVQLALGGILFCVQVVVNIAKGC